MATRRSTRRALFETLESRMVLTALPFGAMPDDTGEYMLGDVRVTVVLLESNPLLSPGDNGDISVNGSPVRYTPENWTADAIAAVKSNVQAGIEWWKDTLDAMEGVRDGLLNFSFDWTYADNPVQTGFEPIARKSDDFSQWIYDFLGTAGFTGSAPNFSADIRAFNNYQRQQSNADWAFTIFVVNNANDIAADPNDGKFAMGGSFDQAFAFAGGRFMVVPASRPPSTYAHEAAHMFWALDEYAGGSTYTAHRGYYDTQNSNAEGNPQAGFVQAPSVMALDRISGNPNVPSTFPRTEAYAAHTSSRPSLEMIGWKDTDGDNIFDVLDVPFTLTGTGRYDSSLGRYKFSGDSAVRTFANQNPAGLQNDITINRIRVVEYAIDNGPWTVYQSFPDRTYKTALDLSIPLSPGEHTIKIRTHDTRTGVMSPEFIGHTSTSGNTPSSTPQAGISGFVYSDTDGDGSWDDDEAPLVDWAVELVDEFGGPVVLQRRIEPDDYVEGTSLTAVHPQATLTAVGSDAGVDEVQRLAINGSGGSVTPQFLGVLGSSLDYVPGVAPTAAAVQASLEAIAALSGNVQVTGAAGGPFTVTFSGNLSRTNVQLITQGAATGNAGLSATTTTEGIANGVFAFSSQKAPSARKVFAGMSTLLGGTPVETWTSNSRRMRVDFSAPVGSVSLRALGSGATSVGRLEAYDAAGNLIERYTTGALSAGQQELMTIRRPTPDIAYVIGRAHLGTEVILDTLTWGANSSATTNLVGAYSLSNLDSASYRVKVTPPAGHIVTTPGTGYYSVDFIAGQNAGDLNFGLHRLDFSNPWHNLVLAENVNGDLAGLVNVLDVLAVVNWITSQGGVAQLPPAGDTQASGYVDVDNNGICNVLDVLAVVNYITAHAAAGMGGGSGESGLAASAPSAGSGGGPGAGGQGEGEELFAPANAAEYYAAQPVHFQDIPGTDLPCCCGACMAVQSPIVAENSVNASTSMSSPATGGATALLSRTAQGDDRDNTADVPPARRAKLTQAIDLVAADVAQLASYRARLARRVARR